MTRLKSLSSPTVILPLFATLGLIGILNHDMWRDEMNTWLIVRDSHSLAQMLSYVNYQGHPALWALLVSLVHNVSASPMSMQLLHWGLGVSAVSLFWMTSQFTRTQKVLFTFGYIPFYEYFLISRPYVLAMLCLFLFCAFYPTRTKSYLGVAIALGLMANSHAFGTLTSIATALTLGLEFCWDPEVRSRYWKSAQKYDWLLSLFALGLLYAFAFMILNPPADSANFGGQDGWNFQFDPKHILIVLGRILAGYTLIIPARQWLDLVVGSIFSLAFFSLTIAYLTRYRTPLLFYILTNGILLSFFYFRYPGYGARHYGYLYLILVAALWLTQFHPQPQNRGIQNIRIGTRYISIPAAHRAFFTLVLLLQFGGGLYRFPLDLVIPHSAAHAAVQYLQANQLDQEFIMGSQDSEMAAISGYLGRQIYYPEVKALGSFTIFNTQRTLVDQAEILAQAYSLLPQIKTCRILLIVTKPLKATHPQLTISPIQKFERSWHDSERMYLYWVKPSQLPEICPQ